MTQYSVALITLILILSLSFSQEVSAGPILWDIAGGEVIANNTNNPGGDQGEPVVCGIQCFSFLLVITSAIVIILTLIYVALTKNKWMRKWRMRFWKK